MNSSRFACLLVVAALLAACGTTSSPTVGSTAPAQSRIEGLQDQLRRDLRGTPVVVERMADGQVLRIAVPRADSFETGRSAVRPALGAVLARIAPTLKSNRRWAVRVAGPVDGTGKGTGHLTGQGGSLALDRAASARDYLVGRGASPLQFQPAARSADATVLEVQIAASAEALAQLKPPAAK